MNGFLSARALKNWSWYFSDQTGVSAHLLEAGRLNKEGGVVIRDEGEPQDGEMADAAWMEKMRAAVSAEPAPEPAPAAR